MLGSMPGGSDFLCLCAKQMSPTPAACRSVSRSARSEILPLQAQRQVALESHLVAVGEPFRFGGDRAEQVDQRFRLALVIAAQDMAGHAVLVPRMADADAYAAEILADVAEDRTSTRLNSSH